MPALAIAKTPDGGARGASFRSGKACWQRKHMASGGVMRLQVVMRAQRGVERRRVVSTVVAGGQNLARRRAQAAVTIRPAFGGGSGGVTG